MEKNYNPRDVEDRIYENWLEKKYFHAEIDKTKKPFTIVMPPPNVTGQLHLGHALNVTVQDILIRFKRMQGYSALWLPGTDHASISTELKVIATMAEEGITKEQIGRDAFLERAWQWKDEYRNRIVSQIKKMGSSCDWERERFTMDEGLSNGVNEVFKRLYDKGYIYRGEKLINWCPDCETSISDAEVEHKDLEGYFYHMKYKIVGTENYLQFATTRPETLLGDTAIAVHPEDERYKEYIGQKVLIPIVNREISVIADSYVEMEFGTGVVKITPAHDPNDFEIGLRHNLPMINIMNDDGTLNENAAEYKGLDRFEARKKIIEYFKSIGQFVKEEKINHAVGVHDRCNKVVEPLIKRQWFVKMEELAKPAIEANKKGEVNFVPEHFSKTYLHWLENIKDWCISRQLWWGHRIPAYYCTQCNHIEVSKQQPDKCSCGSTDFKQDEDTLDTWFSSALWPFATLGWPEKTEDLEYFYPTNALVTSYDIIFFWVVRMVFSAIEQTEEAPFKDVLIHGIIRDAQGRKMSKSLGNGIDPLDLIDSYGTDALRLSLILGNSIGTDIRVNIEKVESCRNFLNKIWNAARFMLMHLDGASVTTEIDRGNLTATDKWILSKCNTLIKEATENMEAYDLSVALQKIYDFLWNEYCDWYVELVKPRLYDKEDETREAALWTLKTVFIDILKLLHPYIPFITEEVFSYVQTEEDTIMLSKWAQYSNEFVFDAEEKEIEILKEAVKNIRAVRVEMNVPPSKKANAFVVSNNESVFSIFKKNEFKALASIEELVCQSDKQGISEQAVAVVVPEATIYIPFEELVDINKELERLQKEKEKFIAEVSRLVKKLSNEGFVKKAPESVIAEEQEKLTKYKKLLAQVEEQMIHLSSIEITEI